MMSKYYIPTSSLNFNNIFSSESISPPSFYAKRDFGYRNWTSIWDGRFNNVIVLFDKPYEFSRPENGLEDHPMLIEFTTTEHFKQCDDGVYISDKTIYLNPFNTRIIFFSEDDKNIALIQSESSLETKVVELYKNNIVVEHFDELLAIPVDMPVDALDIDDNIADDQKINKLMGLLYGFYIGKLLSTSELLNVKRICALREIKNIFDAILASPDRIPTHGQSEAFKKALNTLSIYIDWDNFAGKRELHKYILKTLSRLGINLEALLAPVEIIQLPPDPCKLLENLHKDHEEKINPSVGWAYKELSRLQNHILKENRNKDVLSGSPEISDGKLAGCPSLIDNRARNFYITFVNDLFLSPKYNGKISLFNRDLADEVTKKARDILGRDWEGSAPKTYLNQLRRHLAGEEFNQPWDNGLLSSLAAVLLKGDDWEKMLQFMQAKGMSDYSIAFSLYGALNGFANLTRDFTDIIFAIQEKEFIFSLYEHIQKRLFGNRQPADGAFTLDDNKLSDNQSIAAENKHTSSPLSLMSINSHNSMSSIDADNNEQRGMPVMAALVFAANNDIKNKNNIIIGIIKYFSRCEKYNDMKQLISNLDRDKIFTKIKHARDFLEALAQKYNICYVNKYSKNKTRKQ